MGVRLAVAMCTYQGVAHLAAQLASVDAQDRPPDEVVVADDGSADGTLDLLRDWASSRPYVRLLPPGPAPLGAARNFERAIAAAAAGGGVVVLADQDDVWLPRRLAVLEAALAAEPRALLAFSDATCVDDTGRDLGYTAFASVRLGPVERAALGSGAALDLLLRRPLVTGATVAFRTTLCERALPFPAFVREQRGVIHDRWLSLVAAALGPLAVVPEPLVRYRQHAGQQLGLAAPAAAPQHRRSLVRRRGDYALNAEVAQALAQRVRSADPRTADRLDAEHRHWSARAALPGARVRRVAPVVRELAARRYTRYSRGWSSAAADLLAPRE